ncbi:MAG: urease accessory protein UreH domain-containing protein [Candidatus Humimicrobiaceae bacterium]
MTGVLLKRIEDIFNSKKYINIKMKENILNPDDDKMVKTILKFEYHVSGMHCPACELVIEKKIEKLKYIRSANAVLSDKKVYIETENEINKDDLLSEVNELIKPHGYEISHTRILHKVNFKDLAMGFGIAAAIVGIFFLIQKLGITNILGGKSMSLALVFLIGIVASLSSCMAIVGGLVLSISSSYAKGKDRVMPLIFFHGARIIGFFLLGGVVGLIGMAFKLTPVFYFAASIILFIVMLFLGINLLDVFPFFRKLQLRMPKSLSKRVTGIEKIGNKFVPFLLGILTFFLPCGFTQSMQINAMTSGNFLQGGLIMLVFSLGTLPVLALISFSSVRFSHSLKSGIFFKTAGFIVIFFAIFNFMSALVAAGAVSPIF